MKTVIYILDQFFKLNEELYKHRQTSYENIIPLNKVRTQILNKFTFVTFVPTQYNFSQKKIMTKKLIKIFLFNQLICSMKFFALKKGFFLEDGLIMI